MFKPYALFLGQTPTRKQAIKAWNEYLHLQYDKKNIPSELQDFINFSILRLKRANELKNKLEPYKSGERKDSIDSMSNHSLRALIYYLYTLDNEFITSQHKNKKQKEIIALLEGLNILQKKVIGAKTIDRRLKEFQFILNTNTERIDYLETNFEYISSSLQPLKLGMNKTYHQSLLFINHWLSQKNQSLLTHDEIKYLIKEIISELTLNENFIKPYTYLEERKDKFIKEIKMINEISRMPDNEASIIAESIYQQKNKIEHCKSRHYFDNQTKHYNQIIIENKKLLSDWNISLNSINLEDIK